MGGRKYIYINKLTYKIVTQLPVQTKQTKLSEIYGILRDYVLSTNYASTAIPQNLTTAKFYGDPLGGAPSLHAQKSDYNSYSTTTYNKHNSYNTNDKYKFDDNNIYNNS